jgi:hypothetical protein
VGVGRVLLMGTNWRQGTINRFTKISWFVQGTFVSKLWLPIKINYSALRDINSQSAMELVHI